MEVKWACKDMGGEQWSETAAMGFEFMGFLDMFGPLGAKNVRLTFYEGSLCSSSNITALLCERKW